VGKGYGGVKYLLCPWEISDPALGGTVLTDCSTPPCFLSCLSDLHIGCLLWIFSLSHLPFAQSAVMGFAGVDIVTWVWFLFTIYGFLAHGMFYVVDGMDELVPHGERSVWMGL